MPEAFQTSLVNIAPDPNTPAFYRDVLIALQRAQAPFLVGGAYAFSCYTGIQRPTKDIDLFIRHGDYERVSKALADAGYETELTYPHWLAKVRVGEEFIDLIFSSGNGIADVDDEWFDYAATAQVLGVPVKLSPVEEAIWSKAFIMERERYDGADIAHLIRAWSQRMDWPRLLRRFGQHWRVLFSHLVLFGFIYPAERANVPHWVMDDLMQRLRDEYALPPDPTRLCQGTLLSREQYLADTEQQGYQDGREIPFGNMTHTDVVHWTEAIPDRNKTA